MSDLVGNPEHRFSRVAAQIRMIRIFSEILDRQSLLAVQQKQNGAKSERKLLVSFQCIAEISSKFN